MSRTLMLALLPLLACNEYDLIKDGDAPFDDEEPPAGTIDDDDGRPGDDVDPGDEPEDTDDDPPLGTSGVRGRICDPSGGDWVVGARVYVDLDPANPGTLVVETTTDGDGWFELLNLPDGAWTIYVEKGSFSASFDVVLVDGELLELAEPECLDTDGVNIAVITGEYDDIGHILDNLAVPYTAYEGVTTLDYMALLGDPNALAAYDIVFINCGVNFDWLASYTTVGRNLSEYVVAGGSLYVSDWAYYFVEVGFGSAIDFYGEDARVGEALVGDFGTLGAVVADPVMQQVLGQTSAELYFDYNNWAIPQTAGANTTVLITADAPLYESSVVVTGAPMAVRHNVGDGQVLFTAFHNERQNTLHMDQLLREIVLSL